MRNVSEQSGNDEGGQTVRMVAASVAQKWLERYRGSDRHPVALLVVGIKDLGQINRRLGRADGDALIERVGEAIAGFAGQNIEGLELAARLQGREFLLAIGGAKKEQSLKFAEDLLKMLSGDFGQDGEALHISARIGIAIADEAEAGEELLHRASHALAEAYGRKGKKFVVAGFKKEGSSKKTSTLDADLRKAVEKQQITIMLQPQFAVANGQLIGAEALARWHHPALGEVGADDLFAAADRCDLREELSHVIQTKAIAIAANWPAALDALRLSVNLGAEELTDGYSKRLLTLLTETGFPAERLTLELTEESLVRDAKLAAVELERLRGLQIRIALDDFGTGYSSLAYLKDLPLDYLKIDKGMTPDIGGKGKDRIVLRAIIAMGKALGLMIIAEGVEKDEELEMLKAEECDYFQGFLRSEPLSSDAFERFALRSN